MNFFSSCVSLVLICKYVDTLSLLKENINYKLWLQLSYYIINCEHLEFRKLQLCKNGSKIVRKYFLIFIMTSVVSFTLNINHGYNLSLV